MLTFFLIGLVGFMLLVGAKIVGHDGLDHGGDFGGGHDFGGHDFGGHDVSHDTGDHQAEHQDRSPHGPSPFSLRTIGVFVMIFGFSGLLAMNYGKSYTVASIIGILSGFAAATLAYWFFRILYAQQGNSTIAIGELIGKTGMVINTIPADGFGEITVVYKGQRKELLARSDLGQPVGYGRTVKIVEDLGTNVRVEPVAAVNA